MKRREFFSFSAGLAGSSLLVGCQPTSPTSETPTLSQVVMPDKAQQCRWLGPSFWGNRLQDWESRDGMLQCTNGGKGLEVRTAALLSHRINDENGTAHLRVAIRNLTPGEKGFAGFLIGTAPDLDYRGAALAQRYAGAEGGLLCAVDDTGDLSLYDFSDQANPLNLTRIEGKKSGQWSWLPENTNGQHNDVLFDLIIAPTASPSHYQLTFVIQNNVGEEMVRYTVSDLPAHRVAGAISLVSSPLREKAGARFGFYDMQVGGSKVSSDTSRELGPVMGCMYSLNQTVLKMSVQYMPVDERLMSSCTLQTRKTDESTWVTQGSADIAEGYCSLFRVENWDPNASAEYRILDSGTKVPLFSGKIVADPQTSRPLNVALFSCMIPTSKSLDQPFYNKLIPQERILGRYTKDNILFPHAQMVENCEKNKPDLYVFVGDQYYETYPTRYGRHTEHAVLDTLYRWYLWYWTFRDVIKDTPSVMLADDHDVLQGNLWGNAGIGPKGGKEEDGGYTWDPALVRMVYRFQHGHNPDSYDPTPIANDIPVTYGDFIYGGTHFALVEDRKFKTPPDYDTPPLETRGNLLGERQEAFLADWGQRETQLPKVCITASIWGSPQTKTGRIPLLDYDANGYPPDGRNRAVSLLTKAKALALAGDQHLGMVARMTTHDDESQLGSMFFAGPAASAFWQRWFEGEGQLENKFNGNPDSGDFVDSFGNPMRVYAVANPRLTYESFVEGNTSWGMFLADPALKSEGYGIMTVDHSANQYVLSCWPRDAVPGSDKQFDGWPLGVSFDLSKVTPSPELGSENSENG